MLAYHCARRPSDEPQLYRVSSTERTPEDSATDDPRAGARLRLALAQLSHELRAAIILREVEELTYPEIARILGCPVPVVINRLFDGRERLRELLNVA